jgi:hypothetical protein
LDRRDLESFRKGKRARYYRLTTAAAKPCRRTIQMDSVIAMGLILNPTSIFSIVFGFQGAADLHLPIGMAEVINTNT